MLNTRQGNSLDINPEGAISKRQDQTPTAQ